MYRETAGMRKPDSNVMRGTMKDDAKVAFSCDMIAHHQSAIDMTDVELQLGDNTWPKEMAQKVSMLRPKKTLK
jgi:uncharacterized protein (DUF305 family)